MPGNLIDIYDLSGTHHFILFQFTVKELLQRINSMIIWWVVVRKLTRAGAVIVSQILKIFVK